MTYKQSERKNYSSSEIKPDVFCHDIITALNFGNEYATKTGPLHRILLYFPSSYPSSWTPDKQLNMDNDEKTQGSLSIRQRIKDTAVIEDSEAVQFHLSA